MPHTVERLAGTRRSDAETAALLAALPPETAQAVRELLRERERLGERYRRVVETTGDAMVITDARRAIVFANPAAHALFGHHGETLLGMHVPDLVPPVLQESVAAYERAAFAGAPQRYETEVLRADGERRVVSVATAALREGGVVTGVVASLRDITAERARDAALRRVEARYERLVETAVDAIFTLDADGRFTSVNRAFERSIGASRDVLRGVRFSDVLDDRQRAIAEALFRDTMAGQRQRAEIRFRDAQGSVRTGSITTAPVTEDGRITGALGIVRDVTEERLLAEQLMQREKLAAVGQLVSGVAHELNNPLAGIMAFAQLLDVADDVPEQHRDAVETIHREARRAAKIVSNLLLFARQRHPERSSTDVNRVILDTLELRRYVLTTQQVDVVVDLDADLPPVWADPFQLQQVMLNLLTNAEHALRGTTGPRRIELRTRRDGERLVASVSDTGRGIAADQLDHIFNPFFTTKDVGEGTGLGLSISDGIVRQHGGHITVTSTPGVGSTFAVDLPFTVPPPSAPRADATPAPASSPPRTFLIIDDEPSIRGALSRHLHREGHAVDAVGTGSEALVLLRRRRYDAILLDLRMPDIAGDDLYAMLRAGDPEHADRVVFATGDVDSDGARAFLRDAQRPYVAKPFLLETVTRALCRAAAG